MTAVRESNKVPKRGTPDRDRGVHTEGHAPVAWSGVPLVAMGVPEYASLGRRIETRDGARATVRYVGSVDGQDGEWVGVEWDDPSRGKHDGSHDGKRYFECAATDLEPGALPASFVRAHKIRPSVTFAAAIRAKYLDGKGAIAKVPKTRGDDADADADADDGDGEAYVQSSNGQKIEIELCLKKDDPVAALAALDRVYLPDAAVATAGAPGEASECGLVAARVRLMDLSGNLMRDWPAVARFGEEFPKIEELNLNHVRLDWHSVLGCKQTPFANLRVLSLNGSGCDWASARAVAAATPSLRELSLARCGVRSLGGADASASASGYESEKALAGLEALNLEGNCLAEWSEVETLAALPNLARLHLGGNRLKRVRYPSRASFKDADARAPFASLRGLFLADNAIDEWESIDSLEHFPELAEVRLTGNPVTASAATRHEIVARVSRLSQLNGSLIADQERKDAEIRYLRRVLGLVKTACDETPAPPGGRLQTGSEAVAANHPRLSALIGSYGELSVAAARKNGDGSMGDDMISVTLVCVAASAGEKPPLTKKIPGSTTVGKLKLLCEKLFKVRANTQRLFHEQTGVPLPEKLEPDDYDVAYLGVRDGARVLVEEGADE
jgi:hypothetical protein